MRYARQSKILEIIKNAEIDTQEKLAEKLNAAGYKATQATVSRDIKELGLIKVAGRAGRGYALWQICLCRKELYCAANGADR